MATKDFESWIHGVVALEYVADTATANYGHRVLGFAVVEEKFVVATQKFVVAKEKFVAGECPHVYEVIPIGHCRSNSFYSWCLVAIVKLVEWILLEN